MAESWPRRKRFGLFLSAERRHHALPLKNSFATQIPQASLQEHHLNAVSELEASMLLVCGDAGDPLIDAIRSLEDQQGGPAVQFCSESELFGSTGLAFQLDRESAGGLLQVKNESIAFAEFEGIVLRLPRTWWPGDGFDLQDQMFVYHETLATWFALVQAVACPVANRFGLGWWLQDLGYPAELRASLGHTIQLPLIECEYNDNNIMNGRLVPTCRSGVGSVYRSGGTTFAAPGCSAEVLRHLEDHQQDLLRWEQESGIILSRLDFDTAAGLRLSAVEAFPLFNGEKPELVEGVAGALLQRMRRGQEALA